MTLGTADTLTNRSLIAPAGFGKTHEIVSYTESFTAGTVLILTHTNAGVDALRNRLQSRSIPSTSYRVDTIAAWAMRFAIGFPATSGYHNGWRPKADDYRTVYGSLCRMLDIPAIRKVVESSYSVALVDEYQDCDIAQHALILKLSTIIPCSVLGDPMQGLFTFGKDPSVNWVKDVAPNFPPLPELGTPYRWNGSNPELGIWLSNVRKRLENGDVIPLSGAPINALISSNPTQIRKNEIEACYSALSENGSVVAVYGRSEAEPGQNKFAKLLGGRYQVLETRECRDLLKFTQRFEKLTGTKLSASIIEFVSNTSTKISTEFKSAKSQFSSGKTPDLGRYKGEKGVIIRKLARLAENKQFEDIAEIIGLLAAYKGALCYRREVIRDMRRALLERKISDIPLDEIGAEIRNVRFRSSQHKNNFVIGRTLTVKGQEYTNGIVLHSAEWEPNHLYVALTRASKSLTIVSSAKVIKPAY